ncbi:hypothetical protein GCM10010469_52570 [Streptomyces labedae]|uniref:Uncharacterized protein n=1 Tax=Streptomyces labedae TaxID=285569 RepID=A0ABP6R4J1_9ACTN
MTPGRHAASNGPDAPDRLAPARAAHDPRVPVMRKSPVWGALPAVVVGVPPGNAEASLAGGGEATAPGRSRAYTPGG